MRSSLFLLLSLCSFLIFSACQEEKASQEEASSHVNIHLQAKHLASDTVKVLTIDMLTGKSVLLAEAVLDSSGIGKMNMAVEHSLFATLDYQPTQKEHPKNNQLYLEPGDSLMITLDGEAPEQTLSFEGEGAEVNNYLARSFLIRKPFFRRVGKLIWQLEQQAFLDRLDSIRFSMETFLQQYADSVDMDADMKALMEKRNEIDVLKEEVRYAFLLQNNFVVKAISNGETVGEYQLPEAFSNVYQRVPYDTNLIKKQMPHYALLLQRSMDATVAYPLYFGTSAEERENMPKQMPSMIDSLIRTQYDQAKFPDYFLAWNISSWMDRKGISPDIDSLYHQFLRNNSNSPYLATLEEKYERWMAISTGSPAPDFYGTTPDGKRLALSDFKGKVVYIDVWATWCGPCRQEFPASIALQKEFAEEEGVSFLYVSIEMSLPDWNTWKSIRT
ncbi:hypothetical protein OKW21_006078 [Catalinimonas alkaloidigena]|uniref:TlpA family protein disulfide reductase n=1 Tax=Catalinimonas alkaloidigena TaxID=1075417 RepID=UPI0024055197|nr:TlpA disulfide reductase family protein [Catalinimonas alkaloidigena]MDF9800815.1 hypothetical protein [Catalinimonas alkaloidigena]